MTKLGRPPINRNPPANVRLVEQPKKLGAVQKYRVETAWLKLLDKANSPAGVTIEEVYEFACMAAHVNVRKLKPCGQCGRQLSARERCKPCPYCDFRGNAKLYYADSFERKP